MAKDDVDVRLRLLNAARFQKDAKDSGKSVEGIGHSAEKAGHLAEKPFHLISKGIAGILAGFAGFHVAKEAISETEDLAKTQINLARNLGLSVEAAGEWAAVAKVRGIDTRQLNMAFATLSRNVRAAGSGSKSAAQLFADLGLTQADVANAGSDFNGFLGQIIEGFGQLPGGIQRTALAQRLFGRGWQALLPIFKQGRESLQENLDLARKYGAVIGGDSVGDLKKFILAQHEAEYATLGLQVTFGTKLAPVLTSLIGKLSSTIGFLQRNSSVIYPLVTGLAVLATAIKAVTLAQTAWDVATDANPIVALGVAIVALGAAIVVAYHKSASFRHTVDDMVGVFVDFWHLLGRVKHALQHLFSGIHWPHIHLPHLSIPGVPGAAAGGNVTIGGGVLVGERGPELLNLPAGARVTPLEPGTIGGLVGKLVAEAPVVLKIDGRTAATSVARFVGDYRDRSGR